MPPSSLVLVGCKVHLIVLDCLPTGVRVLVRLIRNDSALFAPPAPSRTDIYDRMDKFLKLPRQSLRDPLHFRTP